MSKKIKVGITLYEEDLKKIENISNKLGLSKSEIISVLINNFNIVMKNNPTAFIPEDILNMII